MVYYKMDNRTYLSNIKEFLMANSLLFSCIECPSRPAGIMSELPEELLKELSKSKIANIYKKGQTIFYEGNRPFGIYCLNSGKVKLSKSSPEGKELIVRISKAGDLLGYRAFFSEENYSATAEVLEDAAICFLDKEKFMTVLRKHPNFSLKLLQLMGKEMKCAEDNARDLAYKSSQERIVELMLTLKEAYGIVEGNTIKININLSREDLSNILGTTTETAVRLLSWLKEKQLVQMHKKFMYINNIEALEELVPDY